jgi:hypothetical protein
LTEQETNVEIIRHIRDGYGFEDIAVRMGCSAEYTQKVMRWLSDLGLFKDADFFRKLSGAAH